MVRTVLEVAGIRNALSKSLGSTNKTNTAYAAIAALQNVVPSKEWVTVLKRPLSATAAKPKATTSRAKKTEV